MRNQIAIMLLGVLLSTTPCVSQTWFPMFEKVWGTEGIQYADGFHSVYQPNSKQYFAFGTKGTNYYGQRCLVMVTLDSLGTPVNEVQLSPPGIVLAIDGLNFLNNSYLSLAFGTSYTGSGYADIIITRVDSTGNIIFTKDLSFQDDDFAYSMSLYNDSNVVIAGGWGLNGRPTIVSLDHNGVENYRFTIPLTSHIARSACQINDTTVIVGIDAPQDYSIIASCHTNGTLNWMHYPFGSSDTISNYPMRIVQTLNGFEVFYYANYPTPTVNYPFAHTSKICEYDLNGNVLDSVWFDFGVPYQLRYDYSDRTYYGVFSPTGFCAISEDRSVRVINGAIDPSTVRDCGYTLDGGLICAGSKYFAYPGYSDTQYYVVKFDSTGRSATVDFDRLNVFPNPARENTILDFDMQVAGELEITVFDVQGTVLWSAQHAYPASLRVHYPIDLSSYAPGTYIIRVRNENYVAYRRVVKTDK